jgi:hypothetical protein
MQSPTLHKISSVHFDNEFIIIRSNQDLYKFKIDDVSKKLSLATESERNDFHISPGGYGIHWPQIDEDLSLDGFLSKMK